MSGSRANISSRRWRRDVKAGWYYSSSIRGGRGGGSPITCVCLGATLIQRALQQEAGSPPRRSEKPAGLINIDPVSAAPLGTTSTSKIMLWLRRKCRPLTHSTNISCICLEQPPTKQIPPPRKKKESGFVVIWLCCSG